MFEASGTETHFTNGFDPAARARRLFHFPKPETLAGILKRKDAEHPRGAAASAPCPRWRSGRCAPLRSRRINQHFTLKKNPLRREDLDDFVSSYASGRPRSERIESERWKSFAYDELVARDKVNLDITWLRDESLEDADNLPSPEVIAREIVEDLTAALVEFEAVAAALESAD